MSLTEASKAVRGYLDRHRDLIKRLARIATLEIAEGDLPSGAVQVLVDEAVGYLPLAEVVDITEERGRLERELGKAEAEIGKLEKKLGNEQFLAKAPQEVIDEQRARLDEAKAVAEKLAAAINRLRAA